MTNTNFNKAVEDTTAFSAGGTTLADMFLANMDQGVMEYALNQLNYGFNSTVGQFYVAMFDLIANKISEDGYTKEQVDGIVKATSNLDVQDAAKRSYNYYCSLYDTTKNLPKKVTALKNMKDTTLVYMLAGHNAWKAFEFDRDLQAASAVGTEEIAEHISYLLSFGEEDFNVYQNAMNTKYAIMANQGNREQSIYFFSWDAEKAKEVGGVEFSLEGRDADNKGLLHKYMFNHQYFQQNGMLVGNIYKAASDKDSARVEYYATDGLTELVIRPENAKGDISYVDMKAAEGIMVADNMTDLTQYLVQEADGTLVYRIPLPLGSGVSDGMALPTETISAMAEPGSAIEAAGDEEQNFEEDGILYQEIDYVATPPFDGAYTYGSAEEIYTIRYNTQMLYIAALSNPWCPYIGFAEDKDNMFTEEVCQLVATDETIEQYHESMKKAYEENLNYKNVSIGEIKYLKAGENTIGYFEGQYTKMRMDFDITFFQVDYGNDYGLRGTWNNVLNTTGALTFEKFMIEAFSNIEVPGTEAEPTESLQSE